MLLPAGLRGWLMGAGAGDDLRVCGPCVQSEFSPPASGTGRQIGGNVGGEGGGGGSGTGDGGQGGTCPASQATDLPNGINLNNDCPYVGANTAGCGAAR